MLVLLDFIARSKETKEMAILLCKARKRTEENKRKIKEDIYYPLNHKMHNEYENYKSVEYNLFLGKFGRALKISIVICQFVMPPCLHLL